MRTGGRNAFLPRAVAVLAVAFFAGGTPAQAWVFHDGAAFAQRLAQYIQIMTQWRQAIKTGGDQLMAFKAAYMGLKDWRNFAWVDVVRLADSPWFDGIEGIDEIRSCTTLTVMTAEQAQGLWENAEFYNKMLLNPRYANDPWYRAKVQSLLRQSKKAQKVKTAVLRQFEIQNKELIEDVKKIRRVKQEIEAANQQSPVDAAKIASLQAELQATEAKFQGNSLILRNQQAIMFLAGENDAQKTFMETLDRGWIRGNTQALRKLGAGFARRR